MPFLQVAPLDLAALTSQVVRADRGGVATFVGLVRNRHAGRTVVSLSYSAYGPMAEQVCHTIVAEAERRWPVGVALAHRVGDLVVGDAAVAVVVAASHRDEAFAACRWVVDEVKGTAPIWKRERYADGTEAWVDPTAADGVVPSSTPR